MGSKAPLLLFKVTQMTLLLPRPLTICLLWAFSFSPLFQPSGIFDWSGKIFCAMSYIGEGNGTPLQYSCLENPMDGGAWWAAVHGVMKSRTRLSDFTFTFHFHTLEKEMATHSSVLAWRIPGTGEPGGLPSMGSHRVWHDWSDLATAAAACPTQIETHSAFEGRKVFIDP